mmetsp:Transcript_53924/g.121857  ORF Transcript_53924/g.121857 Transcript_53924/m.121857 type:complete len:422 (-) Transcript_53924:62-1327(-)
MALASFTGSGGTSPTNQGQSALAQLMAARAAMPTAPMVPPSSEGWGTPGSSMKNVTATTSKGPSSGFDGRSEASTAAPNLAPAETVRPQAAGVERRLGWLEEDVAVLHQRLREECADGAGGVGGAASDSGLRALVARLDGELAAERHSRSSLEARMDRLEECLIKEKKEREIQLSNFSTELENTMRGLIGRIDESLCAGATTMRERTDMTEERLRMLIGRVDEGLSAGAAALQDTLTSAGNVFADANEQLPQSAAAPSGAAPCGPSSLSPTRAHSPVRNRDSAAGPIPSVDNSVDNSIASVPAAEELIQSWDQLRQENIRLRERHAQLRNPPSGRASPLSQSQHLQPHMLPQHSPGMTPSLAYPNTMQVPGSGLSVSAGYAQPMGIPASGTASRGGVAHTNPGTPSIRGAPLLAPQEPRLR